jgi:hypothetical protein
MEERGHFEVSYYIQKKLEKAFNQLIKGFFNENYIHPTGG